MEVTDIATGHFVFAPVPGKRVSYQALDGAIRGAGYEVDRSAITLSGEVTDQRHLRTPNGQLFHLEAADPEARQRLEGLEAGARVVVTGAWRTVEGAEVVTVGEEKE
jgi:hypothetical protein